MKNIYRTFHLTAILVAASLICLTLTGCAGKSAPSRFYLMTSDIDATTPVAFNQDYGRVTVGITPVKLPAYLNRPQIVTRTSNNRLNLSEFDKWAEPLDETIFRLVLGNLSTRLYPDKIAVRPWQGRFDMDYQVNLTVIRLDNTPSNEAILVVRWSLLKGNKHLISTQRSIYTYPSDTLNFEAFAAAQSKNLDALCKEIAQAIKCHTKHYN